jgi:hypothetical protein
MTSVCLDFGSQLVEFDGEDDHVQHRAAAHASLSVTEDACGVRAIRPRPEGRSLSRVWVKSRRLMIKTILVPITGGHNEESVFESALAAARPLRGHIEFYRVRFCAQAAAVQDPHAGFCVGGATSEMLKGLAEQEQDLSSEAKRHFHRFCCRHDIVETSSPAGEGALRGPAAVEHLTVLSATRFVAASALMKPLSASSCPHRPVVTGEAARRS